LLEEEKKRIRERDTQLQAEQQRKEQQRINTDIVLRVIVSEKYIFAFLVSFLPIKYSGIINNRY